MLFGCLWAGPKKRPDNDGKRNNIVTFPSFVREVFFYQPKNSQIACTIWPLNSQIAFTIWPLNCQIGFTIWPFVHYLAQPMNSKIAKPIWLFNGQIVHAIWPFNGQIVHAIWPFNGQIVHEQPSSKTYLSVQRSNNACHLAIHGLEEKKPQTMTGSALTTNWLCTSRLCQGGFFWPSS